MQIQSAENPLDGGACSIFVVIDALMKGTRLSEDRVIQLVSSLKPDFVNNRLKQNERSEDQKITDTVLFILSKVLRALKQHQVTAEHIFKQVSHGNSEDLVPAQILMKYIFKNYGLIVSEEERRKLVQHVIGAGR